MNRNCLATMNIDRGERSASCGASWVSHEVEMRKHFAVSPCTDLSKLTFSLSLYSTVALRLRQLEEINLYDNAIGGASTQA
jgi:hypothetical protein